MNYVVFEPTLKSGKKRRKPCHAAADDKCSHVYHYKPVTSPLLTGRCAENLVVWYLKQRGWRVMHRNYRTQSGEIDIIAAKTGADIPGIPTVIFVEVKSRSTSAGLPPESRVTASKQRKIIACSRYFISRRPRTKAVYRCDIASVILIRGRAPQIRYIPNAFCAKEDFGW